MKASFGPLQVNLRYTYSRKGTLYYQRPIPKELQPRYGKKLVKVKLKSADVLMASREVDRLNRQVELSGNACGQSLHPLPKFFGFTRCLSYVIGGSQISPRKMTPPSWKLSSIS